MGSVRVRLSIMMFLEYAIWGVWAPTLSLHLAKLESFREAVGDKIGWVYLGMPLATILSPFIAGQLADRYFATQRFLAFSHLVGGAFILAAAFVTDFMGIFWLILGHCLLYAPTVALTNSLAFHHLPNGEKDFGGVRLWGTIGWIAIGWAFGAWLDSVTGASVGQCLLFAGVLSFVMAAYCLTLPHTPPAKTVQNPFAFLEALKLVRKPSFAVMLIVALVVSTELQFYYILTQNFFSATPGKSLSLAQLREVTGGEGLPAVAASTAGLANSPMGPGPLLTTSALVPGRPVGETQAKLLMRLLDANGDNQLSMAELANYNTQVEKAQAMRQALQVPANQDQIQEDYVKAWNARSQWPLPPDVAKQLASTDAAHLIAEVEPGSQQLTPDKIGEFVDQVQSLGGQVTKAETGFDAYAVDRGGLGLTQANAIRVLTIGQFVEIGVLALLPFALRKIGFTWTIGIGIIAWAIRYGMFAWGQPAWAVILSQALHGFGFGFFFAGCMVYSDRLAPKDVRASGPEPVPAGDPTASACSSARSSPAASTTCSTTTGTRRSWCRWRSWWCAPWRS